MAEKYLALSREDRLEALGIAATNSGRPAHLLGKTFGSCGHPERLPPTRSFVQVSHLATLISDYFGLHRLSTVVAEAAVIVGGLVEGLTSMLADLDELVLRCRDERAKSYIVEAVACYRAGAYRSAIVATWVAVCYDIIDKLRELALAGDKGAEQILETLDNARQSNDLPQTLKLERKLIDLARDQFELISPIEYVDLDRLREDRNRCAHPSLISDEVKFSASAELARAHIRAAVIHLLEHPPAQGKLALERLMREVSSEYFPTSTEGARKSLSLGPLKRPRESLVKNFAVVLFKRALSDDFAKVGGWKTHLQVLSALAATQQLHPQTFAAVLQDKINVMLQRVEDENLSRVISVLLNIEDIWHYLGPDVRNRLENYVSYLPEIRDLDRLLDFKPLAGQARKRLEAATIKELDEWVYLELHELIAERYIQYYLESKNYAQANERFKQLGLYAADLSEAQQRRIIAGIDANDQLRGSFGVGLLISALRNSGKIQPNEFDELLRSLGLEGFIPHAGEDAAE
jgi:hypothetical protein